MNKKLKHKISRLEAQMNANAAFKEQQLFLLKRHLKKPLVISAAAVTTVGLGYLVARKGGLKLLLRVLVGTPFFILRSANTIRLLSSVK